MSRPIHKKRIIIILTADAGVILATFVAFMVYVSIYYKTESYIITEAYKDIIVKEYDDYTVYGDLENSDVGIIFYPGGKVEAKAYEPLMYEFASRDICCVLVSMPFNLAVFGINQADISNEEQWHITAENVAEWIK